MEKYLSLQFCICTKTDFKKWQIYKYRKYIKPVPYIAQPSKRCNYIKFQGCELKKNQGCKKTVKISFWSIKHLINELLYPWSNLIKIIFQPSFKTIWKIFLELSRRQARAYGRTEVHTRRQRLYPSRLRINYLECCCGSPDVLTVCGLFCTTTVQTCQ